jgi:hypothetical protein
LVFYQFGKFLTKKPLQPIIDQHVIRAFALFSNKDLHKVDNIRMLDTLDKTHKVFINNYIDWLLSDNLEIELKKNKDYMYHIDKLLFAIGKTLKILKK